MRDVPKLVDIRQIGPNSNRDISGICPGCGDTLFARLDQSVRANHDVLEQRLQDHFEQHVCERHPFEIVYRADQCISVPYGLWFTDPLERA